MQEGIKSSRSTVVSRDGATSLIYAIECNNGRLALDGGMRGVAVALGASTATREAD